MGQDKSYKYQKSLLRVCGGKLLIGETFHPQINFVAHLKANVKVFIRVYSSSSSFLLLPFFTQTRNKYLLCWNVLYTSSFSV